MALTGVTVTAGYAGFAGFNGQTQALITNASWQESPASATASTNVAPPAVLVQGRPIFRIRAADDSWVSIGAAPNAANSPRHFVGAGVDYDVAVNPGDKFAWVAA